MSTTEVQFLGFAYAAWREATPAEDNPGEPRREVYAVLDERMALDSETGVHRREVLVRRLRDQRGYGDVVRADETHCLRLFNRPWWCDVESFASVFVGTPTTREGAVWKRKPKVPHLLGTGEIDPILTGGAVELDLPLRLAPVNPDGQPYA